MYGNRFFFLYTKRKVNVTKLYNSDECMVNVSVAYGSQDDRKKVGDSD